MPRLPSHCSTIAMQLAKQMEREMLEHEEFNQRTRRGTEPEDGGFWQTRDKLFMNAFGRDDIPMLTNRERISLQGHVAGYGEHGTTLASWFRNFQDMVDIHHGQDMMGLERFIKGLSKEENRNAISVLEGRPLDINQYGRYIHPIGSKTQAPMNEKVALAVKVLREYFTSRGNVAEKTAVEGFRRIGGGWYFPIMHETSTLRNSKFRLNAIKSFAEDIAKKAGRGVTDEDMGLAAKVYTEYISGQRTKINGNLQRHREFDFGEGRVLDLPHVIDNYAKQFWHTVEEKRIFGAKGSMTSVPKSVLDVYGKILADPINQGKRGVEKYVDAYINDTLGITPHDPTMFNSFMRTLGNLQVFKLSTSVFKNASQTMNSFMRTDLKATMKAMDAWAFNRELFPGVNAREFYGSIGSVTDEAVRQALAWSPEGILGKAGEVILNVTGFTPVEHYNRAVAGLTGSFYAKQQAWGLMNVGNNKKFVKNLTNLGLNVEKIRSNNGQLDLVDMLLAGQRVVNETQFRSRLSDLPFFATNAPDLWRGMLQFKTFASNHTRLMVDQAYRRPVRTALFGLGIMPAAGYGVQFAQQKAYDFIPGYRTPAYQENQSPTANYLESAAAGGSWGWVSDIAYSGYMSGKSDGQAFKNFTLPPIMSTVQDYVQMAAQVARGNFHGFAVNAGRQFGGLGSAFISKNEWIDDLPKGWDE